MKQELKTTDNNFITTLTRPLFKEDKEAYLIRIKTESDAERVHVTAFRADGTKVTGTGANPDADGYSEYTLSREMYAVSGNLILRIAILSGTGLITVRQIECSVLEDLNG